MARRIELLVEEPSAEVALRNILPKLVGTRAQCGIINFGRKYKMLQKLPARLAAYKSRIGNGEDLKIIVLIDRDSDSCEDLKAKLEDLCRQKGLATKTRPSRQDLFDVVNRVVIEELETWFLGDPKALRAAFPSLPAPSTQSNLFRNPDNGGTWEALHRYLRRHGIYKGSYPKIEAARRISARMNPDENRSASFQCFCRGVHAALK